MFDLDPHTKRANALRQGLALMPPGFTARLCPVCDGRGRYTQTYNAGCGMGTYRADGPCDWCRESGLQQGDAAAPPSVVNQVLVAASRGVAPSDK